MKIIILLLVAMVFSARFPDQDTVDITADTQITFHGDITRTPMHVLWQIDTGFVRIRTIVLYRQNHDDQNQFHIPSYVIIGKPPETWVYTDCYFPKSIFNEKCHTLSCYDASIVPWVCVASWVIRTPEARASSSIERKPVVRSSTPIQRGAFDVLGRKMSSRSASMILLSNKKKVFVK